MKQANEKYTILYARLSQDDGSQGDSNSIQNQRLMLEKYAKDNGFDNLKFLYDDGATGTNFNRPAFQEVMALIENGEAGSRVASPVVRKVMDAWLLDADGKLKPEYASPSKAETPANDK